jgi:hypothetical protein
VPGFRWSDAEIKLLVRLIEQGHTSISCAVVLNRPVKSIQDKAHRIGHPFGRFGKGKANGVSVHLNLGPEEFATLRNVAAEIAIGPGRLASIIINIVAQQNRWAELLNLDSAESASASSEAASGGGGAV